MRHIKSLLILSFFIPSLSFADLRNSDSFTQAEEENNFLQARTWQSSRSENFWANFWSLLQGKAPLDGSDLQVKVLDAKGTPLKGASVLVGTKKGFPFESNQKTTDENGEANFSDEKIRSGEAIPVTVSLNGYTTVSFLNNTQNTIEVKIQKFQTERDFGFLSGKVTGFPSGIGSGTLEMGIFIPAFQPQTLINFDPQQFVSSYKVKIDVFGEREVPGNIVLPTQRKRYGIIPISLSKPEFQMPLSKGLSAQMLAMAGNVDISEAMDAMKKKDFLAMINLASFTHIGFTNKAVTVRGDERFDLNLSHEISPKTAQAQFASVPEKTDAVAVSLVDVSGSGSDLLPMDVKSLKSEEIKQGAGSVKLGALKQKKTDDKYFVFAGLFNREEIMNNDAASRWLVGSLQPVNSKANAQFKAFLKSIRSESVSSNNREYKFSSAANNVQGVRPSLLIFNLVSEKQNAITNGKTRNVLWTTLIKGDATQVSLPDLGKPVLPAKDEEKKEKFFWEVIAVQGDATQKSQEFDLQTELRNIQHVSTFSQKF
jgi:hypothetical protein